MADVVQSRSSASRGRPSGRAGRGGYASRGGARSGAKSSSNDPALAAATTAAATSNPPLEEQGELGQLKKQYLSQLETLKELFPDWTDDDLVFALQETDGDLQRTIERITEGNVSQFADVKKKTKEKSRSKKDAPISTDSHAPQTRGRGRGGIEGGGRGGRGRGSERGGRGRGGRGAASSAANGTRAVSSGVSVPTAETTGWGDTTAVPFDENAPRTWPPPEDQPTAAAIASWEHPELADTNWGDVTPAVAPDGQKSSLIPEGTKKSWASMLAQPKAPPPKPKAAPVPAAPPATVATETIHQPLASDIAALQSSNDGLAGSDPRSALGDGTHVENYGISRDVSANLPPPQDPLTEDNVENLPDESVPGPTETVASQRDPSSVVGSSTPYASSPQIPTTSRPPMGGYATTAWKATGTPARTASYQRRMMEQREAVVMPGNHAIDRTTVQFGSMGLNGENRPVDIDEDREEAQTRTQPQQSPPSQPRASLPPPAPRQPSIPEQQIPLHDGLPTPKQAPGLPQPPSMSGANQPGTQMPLGAQSLNQTASQANQTYGQYGRFAGGALGQDPGAPAQKQYDAFNQQLNYSQSQQDTQGMFAAHSQASNTMPQTQTQGGGLSQGPSDFGSQYATENQRNAYQNYYGSSYGQQTNAAQQDQNVPPQRSGSGFAAADSGYGSSQANIAQSRFSESQNSGHTTPNPSMVSQSQQNPQHMQHQQQQPPGQAGHGGNYPYANPYYGGGSYYGSYMNQYPSNYYNQQGYGAPFGGKGNMYGQPQHAYGISPQTSYEHSSSPANAQAFGSSGLQGRDSGMAGGLGDYGRSGSAQPSQPNVSSGGAFSGSAADGFGRTTNTLSHNQQYGQQGDEALKAFNESKAGPSPSLGQPGRAGSAASGGAYGGSQSNYPPQQSHQQGFGGYPSHVNQLHGTHGSQYAGGLGGLGGHQGNAQSHQASSYGSYGSGFGGNNYGSYGRGGWGGNYGH